MPSLEDLSVGELLKTAQAAVPGNQLFQALLADPTTRKDTLRLLKKREPTRVIPEIDAEIDADKALAAEREERAKLEARFRDKEIKDRIKEEREAIKAKYKLTDADVLEVEKLMTAEVDPIPNYDGAARVHLASRQQATPTPSSIEAPVYDMPDKDIWKSGIGNKTNLDRVAFKLAAQAQNEFRAANKGA